MTMRKRIARLEGVAPTEVERPVVRIGLAGMTDEDVIGVRTGKGDTIERLPGESVDALVERSRGLLSTPWAGLPPILVMAYATEAPTRIEEEVQ